jgi:succinate dehydrogenase flavin-adding protein (antitoxin of CptAB toxin-antitoxin module)
MGLRKKRPEDQPYIMRVAFDLSDSEARQLKAILMAQDQTIREWATTYAKMYIKKYQELVTINE